MGLDLGLYEKKKVIEGRKRANGKTNKRGTDQEKGKMGGKSNLVIISGLQISNSKTI